MGKRHQGRFEACGVSFAQVLDVDAGEWVKKVESASSHSSSNALADVDFAVIASPATSHYEYARFFLERGIAVFVEKPLAITAEQAWELVRLAERNGAVLFVAQSECFNPIFLNFRKHFMAELRARAVLRSGLQQQSAPVASPVRLEFRREHGYTERCRDVSVSLDILVHDLSMFLTMFSYDDVEIVCYRQNNITPGAEKGFVEKSADRAEMTLKVARGPFAGITADFVADRNSTRDIRTISVDFGDSSYEVSLARYLPSGDIAHIPDSLENEHKFFLKLLVGACNDWGLRAARIAAQVVELATLP